MFKGAMPQRPRVADGACSDPLMSPYDSLVALGSGQRDGPLLQMRNTQMPPGDALAWTRLPVPESAPASPSLPRASPSPRAGRTFSGADLSPASFPALSFLCNPFPQLNALHLKDREQFLLLAALSGGRG